MRKQESSINLLLNLAKQAREHNVSWSCGFEIDKSILEFSQNKGNITYRQARSLTSKKTKINKLKKELIESFKEKFKPEIPCTWVLFNVESYKHDEPAIFPESIGNNGAIVSHKDDIRTLINEQIALFEKNKIIKHELNQYSTLTQPIYQWISQLFINGNLEGEIESYLKSKEYKKNKTRVSHALVKNFIEPTIAEIVEEKGELPSLSVVERQTVQFLFWKLENMNESEQRLKSLLLNGKVENPESGLLVIFEEIEAIRKNYGDNQTSGYHYTELKGSLEQLRDKNRKLTIKTAKDELKLSIPLIKSLEVEHKYSEDPEFKKYVVVYIDHHVVELHEKYTSYPDNHFSLLRNTPPKTNLIPSEVAFFDILYSEIQFDSTKAKVLKREKQKFLKLLDREGKAERNRNLPRIADRVEGAWKEKAINIKILEKFEIHKNAKGEEIYYFHIAARDNIPHF